jgi:uracil-DNA glycosylase
MRVVTLSEPDDFDGWRDAARGLIADAVPPEDVVWQVGDAPQDLFAGEAESRASTPQAGFSVPRAFLDLARNVVRGSDPERFALLYTLLHRLRGEPRLMEDEADPMVRRLQRIAKDVRRDIHKMRAFLRFREVADGEGTRYVAWFEPDHHIVRANAAFFVNRFASMRWSILTPELSLHWDGKTLSEGPGASKADAPEGDPTEEVWKTYYASIFNPARVKIGAMLKEMPRKYWKNMPETALVPDLIARAQARESGMIEKARRDVGGNSEIAWAALREEAMGCTRCPLYKPATQTVFGEGPVDAALMFVGEQPGDQEDLAGQPFVGPAGGVLDAALEEAGIERADVYVTNAVKHFKHEPRGKRRLHKTPNAGEVQACRWWLDAERRLIRPRLVLALGATAGLAVLGRKPAVTKERGQALTLEDGSAGMVTVHPSYLLRLPDADSRAEARRGFVDDLIAASGLISRS